MQDVAEHLEDDGLLGRPDGGRARIEAHARHLTEQVAGSQLRDRPDVVEIDGSIDADAPARLVVVHRVVLAAHEVAEPTEEARHVRPDANRV